MKKHTLYYVLCILGAFAACSKEPLPAPEAIYTKVYDDPNSDRSFYPVDFLELEDGGFYILGQTTIDTTRTWLNTYIMRTDKMGNKIWGDTLARPYMNPIANLCIANDNAVFFCLDEVTQGLYVMQIDEESKSATLVAADPSVTFPLAVSQTPDNGFLLLGYDRIKRSSQVVKLDAQFQKTWTKGYNVNENAQEMLVDHLTRVGKRLPFFTGTIGNGSTYYANGLYNYTLATFFMGGNGTKSGVHYGFRYEGGFNAALPLSESTLALSRFSYFDQYFMPFQSLNTNDVVNIDELGGFKISEVAADSENHIFRASLNETDYLIYAVSTNNNQIALYFYDLTTQEFVGKKLYGFSNPVKVASAKPTADGGLAILIETKVFGRFRRIALQKVPKEDLEF